MNPVSIVERPAPSNDFRDHERLAPAESTKNPAPGNDPASAPLRILIVDDDPIISQLLANILGRIGFRSTTAHNGMEALKVIAKDFHELVLMDYEMPRMLGAEVAQVMREMKKTPRIIGMSAAGEEAREAFRQVGVSEFLEKPFDSHHVEALLLSVLNDA